MSSTPCNIEDEEDITIKIENDELNMIYFTTIPQKESNVAPIPNFCLKVESNGEPIEMGDHTTILVKNDNELHFDHTAKEEMVVGPTKVLQSSAVLKSESDVFEDSSSNDVLENCDVENDQNSNMKIVAQPKENGKKLWCKVCHTVFFDKHDLRKHLLKHGAQNENVCKYCKTSEKQITDSDSQQESQIACYLCSKEFIKKSCLVYHYYTMHIEEKNNGANEQHSGTSRASQKKYPQNSNLNQLQCKFCSIFFSTKTLLTEHLRSNKCNKPFKCHICDKILCTSFELKTHIENHSKNRPFQCYICNKSYTRKVALNIHITTHHTDSLPLTCDYCNKGCGTKKRLKIHMRTHTGEKPYNCKLCSKSFSHYCNMKVHMSSIHCGNKPYECNVCSKTFESKSKLKVHFRVHTGEKPYQCSICDSVFKVSSHVNRHMKRMHPISDIAKANLTD